MDIKDFIKYYWGSYKKIHNNEWTDMKFMKKILRWNMRILWRDFAINYFDKEMSLRVQIILVVIWCWWSDDSLIISRFLFEYKLGLSTNIVIIKLMENAKPRKLLDNFYGIQIIRYFSLLMYYLLQHEIIKI